MWVYMSCLHQFQLFVSDLWWFSSCMLKPQRIVDPLKTIPLFISSRYPPLSFSRPRFPPFLPFSVSLSLGAFLQFSGELASKPDKFPAFLAMRMRRDPTPRRWGMREEWPTPPPSPAWLMSPLLSCRCLHGDCSQDAVPAVRRLEIDARAGDWWD